MRLTIIILAILLPTLALAAPSSILVAHFMGCYDGDNCRFITQECDCVFDNRMTVRLRGIDTPEIKGKCAWEKAAAKKARDRLRGILKSAMVIVMTDVALDKYRRVLAHVIADGVDVSAVLITEGLGREYYGRTKRKGWC